jgi:hypothetical protein
MDVINALDQITIEWLSQVLRQPITTVEVKQNTTAFNSTAAHLTVTYAEKSDLPENLFIKLKQNEDGKVEIECYHALKNVTLKDVIPAYFAAYDEATGQSTLILKDVSKTHQPPTNREAVLALTSNVETQHLHHIIDTLANWHRYWWEKPVFDVPHPFVSAEAFAARVQKYYADWEAFLAKGYTIPDTWHQTYEQALKIIPHIYGKYLASRFDMNKNLTVIHGDCYFVQFMVNDETAYIADFDSVGRSVPTDDLVFLMTTFWTTETRQQHENALLRRYHQTLNQPDYTWDNLILDYRVMILYRIFHAVWDGTYADESYWRPKMRCSLEAYHDWHCSGL